MIDRYVRVCGVWGALITTLLASPVAAAEEGAKELPPPAQRKVDFSKDVEPLLARFCHSCHGPDLQESNFRLDHRASALAGGDYGEPAILPGKSAESPLIRYIAGVDEDLVMPPKGGRMSAAQVGLIRAWIDQGADWPAGDEVSLELTTNHWSFQPLVDAPPPAVKHPHAQGNPIDAFIVEKLLAQGLAPSPAAERQTLIRRLYLDMLGLPPTPEEIAAFVDDADARAYEKLVERVLASPRYGERWARHWLDVVRFAETTGFETNVERPNAWHYRDYVIEAFNSDKPYDQFVREQLAGDAVGVDAATGFLVGGPWDQVKSPDPVLTAMQRSDELADITNTTSTTFLGLTLGCARCHNHKFDPILQKDYYALEAVFAGVQHGERPMNRPKSPGDERRVRELNDRLAELRQQLEALRPTQRRGRLLLIDDENVRTATRGEVGVSLLAEKAGHGVNPGGAERGRKSDPGDFDRFPNVSRGQYTWWSNTPGQNVLAYHPRASGRYRVWLSWGSGHATHTADAQYVLDLDGDLATTDDQRTIATIDQRHFAGEEGEIAGQALWSGFASAGVHEFKPESVLLVRGGKTGTAITADVVGLEELVAGEALAADPVQPPLRPAVNSRENTEHFPPVLARYVRFTALATNSGAEPCLDELEVYAVATADRPARNVALASAGAQARSSGDYQGNPAHRLEHINDGQYGNGRSWISNTAGAGWVEIELPEAVLIDRIVWGRDRTEQYQDRTAVRYVIEVAVEPGEWRPVASAEDRLSPELAVASSSHFFGLPKAEAARARALLSERQRAEEELATLTASQAVYAGRFEKPRVTHRLFRGDPMHPREVVAPDALTVLGTLGLSTETPEQERRLALARWITDPANPLTARVMVNRVWQHHFGTGIVDTPSDLGVNGARPTHPELLDYLAREFMRQGWSLKRLHRLILTSNTYRQSNQPRPDGLKVDAQCRLLWRFPPHRLEAEAIRDAILATSGVLDLKMGGPGWSTFKPNSNYVRVYDPKEEFGPAEWRRAIYMTKVRMRQDGVFGTFDCPDAGQIAPKRARSTTALQALSLFNSPFIIDQAERLAQRVAREVGDQPAAQAQRTFALVLGRAADEDEQSAAAALIAAHGLPALCRAMYNANEFLFIP